MSLQHTLLASALLSSLAAASPQWGNPGGNGGPWGAAFPSCASSCKPSNIDYSNPSGLCGNTDTLNTLNTCVDGSSCSDTDKNDVKETIAQLCVNAGASITASPYNTYSVTSGKSASVTGGPWGIGGGPAQWSSWASENGFTGYPSASSAWASWASANDWPTATSDWPTWASSHGWSAPSGALASEWSSWTSAETITAWPTAASEWSSFTSAHPLPSDWSANGFFPGGSAWPSAWTTNSAWASAVSGWTSDGGFPHVGAPGYHPGETAPWGGAWGSAGPWTSGAWESGPWTKWWNNGACPPSTWTGWTAGPWSDSAPWTSWTACSATATASSVYEITTTNAAGSQITEASTSYGYELAEAGTATGTSSSSTAGAVPTDMAFIGSAAGVLGVIAGAVLL